jgi:hypothetical protein
VLLELGWAIPCAQVRPFSPNAFGTQGLAKGQAACYSY